MKKKKRSNMCTRYANHYLFYTIVCKITISLIFTFYKILKIGTHLNVSRYHFTKVCHWCARVYVFFVHGYLFTMNKINKSSHHKHEFKHSHSGILQRCLTYQPLFPLFVKWMRIELNICIEFLIMFTKVWRFIYLYPISHHDFIEQAHSRNAY